MAGSTPVPDCRHGVVAFGDSITNGGGELQWGVALQSWALWVARGLGLPYTGMARDGACVSDVTRRQIPELTRESGLEPGARYHLGCLYIGVNDVRDGSWSAAAFAPLHAEALRFLTACCRRVLAVTAPVDLGRPPAGAGRIRVLNAVVRDNARAAGALVLELDDFGARNQVMTDHVHPTAFGQIAIAERALAVLAADGLPVQVRPSQLIAYETTRWGRLRGDASYVYRAGKVAARAAWSQARR